MYVQFVINVPVRLEMVVMTEERCVRKCRRCNQLKIRIFARRVGKEKIWHDEDGKTWNGATCPSCHIEVMRLKMRDSRVKKD